MKVLGISCFYHDSAIALIDNDEILFAAQEERFSRVKHDSKFPYKSIDKMLKQLNILPNEIEAIVFYEKPLLKFDRILSTYLEIAPKGFSTFRIAIPEWIKEKLFFRRSLKKHIKKSLGKQLTNNIYFSEHHLSHAASAYYPSPFKEATILTVDGVGEWATTTIGIGRGKELKILKELHFPNSIGLFYSAFTQYCGFRVNSGEYKLMGLAPYGNPIYENVIWDNLIENYEDGSFKLNLEYFDFVGGLQMINNKFAELFGEPCRNEGEEITKHFCDIAASVQSVTEKILIDLATYSVELTGVKNLVMAGGVALNCVSNEKINSLKIVENFWVQPAAGDSGGALGAALAYTFQNVGNITKMNSHDSMQNTYLGTSYTTLEIKKTLDDHNLKYEIYETHDLNKRLSKFLDSGKIIGRFDGKMEYGPRALGNRSIIADARSKKMQSKLNLNIKFRESFRPFAPSVIIEESSNFFELETPSPYMLLTTKVLGFKASSNKNESLLEKLKSIESQLPAITHVDGSARLQTVAVEDNANYYNLINEFYNLTGCPVIVNTSFNVRGEPIVESPEDAVRCFFNTGIDILVINEFLIIKQDQNDIPILNYKVNPGLD